ncbi:hypothetical protein BKA62DRAFT_741991 [Auriculariales sp. MPI-PUGE-AT-0066]|nr:hypothetical protein BKA62DRAFT_741991 [Auriculariales sp. MPI-PUGE-AT-0066]
MSLVALLNESVPHIIAAFLTHVFATLWSGYQVYLTQKFRQDFGRLVIQGPCKANLLPKYWDPRDHTEITILALNVVMTCVVAVLSYKLLKAFGWQTFKKIGASWAINRCYQLVLAFSITIQLAVFFVGANIALWLDQLCHGFISPYAEHRKVYEGIYITALVILIPWLAVGWFAVRKESRVWMAVFLAVAIVMIIGWASMFASRMLRWTFRVWDFFAFMTVAAAVLLVAAISLGVGLPQYLVTDELGVEPSWEPAMESTYGDEEKLVKFPSETSPHPVPTFSDAFVGPDGLDRLRAMSRPAARSGPGIGMHARGTSTSGSVDFFGGLPARPDAAVTITRSASTASRSTLSSFESPTGQPVMNAFDPRMTSLTRINTSESYRSASSQNSGVSAGSRINRNHRWAIDE